MDIRNGNIEKGPQVLKMQMGLLIRDSSLMKFDSANATWGYLRTPELRDTIIVDIVGENISRGGFIKVYQ